MAPASASDIGRTAAESVFMGESLSAVAHVRRVAVAAQSIARQNLGLALAYNLLAVPLAVAGLVSPLLAAVAMSSSSIIVIGNALRLGAIRLPRQEPSAQVVRRAAPAPTFKEAA
jgi:Cu2+-exporting ATPase